MTQVNIFFRGLKLFAALLCILLSAQTQASQVDATKGWLRTFDQPIGEAYILKPLSAFESGPAISDVYIEVIHKKRGMSELVSFQDGLVLGVGCFISSDIDQERPQHIACQKQAHKKIAQKKLTLPECHLDKDEGGYPRTATYFITQQGTRAACAYEMPTLLVDHFLKRRNINLNSNDLTVIKISAIWKTDQLEGIRLGSTGTLANLFPSAPIQQLNRLGLNGARNCLGLPGVLGSFATQNLEETIADEVPYLALPKLQWSYFYLARTKKPIVCADARYDIDILNKPLAYGLADNTMLIRGQRTVLRINVRDGGSNALSTSVKRVGAQEFIETMQADGGTACTNEEPRPEERCKWLSRQGWYRYAEKHPRADLGEMEYSKFWFQGFGQAIKNVFFNQGK